MTTTEILRRFADRQGHRVRLTRDLLYFWEKRGWIAPERIMRDKGPRRQYSEDDANKIQILLECYGAGLTPERSWQMAQLSKSLPVLKLNDLLLASRELTGVLGSRSQVLNVTAKCIQRVMNCESASVLLFPDDFKLHALEVSDGTSLGATIEIVASAEETYADSITKRFTLHRNEQGGLTGWVAAGGTAVNLSGEELRAHSFRAGIPPTHLSSGKCYSFLMCPLKDRKQRIIGYAKVENRKGTSGRPNDLTRFDDVDQMLLEILGSYIVTTIETLIVTDTSKVLLELMPGVASLTNYSDLILTRAISLIGAECAYLVWSDGDSLRVVAQRGTSRTFSQLEVADTSLIREVCERLTSRVANTLWKESGYERFCATSQSAALVPLRRERHCVGVLGVESRVESFFDERDIQILEHLATHIVPAAQMVEARDNTYALLRQDIFRPSSMEATLSKHGKRTTEFDLVLDTVRQETGFDGGLVYLADYSRRRLSCVATIPSTLHDKTFSYSFDSSSMASEIFRTRRALFINQPMEDERVAVEGLEKYRIRSPLLGVPLMFGETALGALVVWARKGPQPKEKDSSSLERYAQIAVTTMALRESGEKHRLLVRSLQAILSLLQTNRSRTVVLHEILVSLTKGGFDRARVFRFDTNVRAFVCLDSTGREVDGYFAGVTIGLDESPYARLTYEEWERRDLKPHLRDPNRTGVDPSSSRLLKPSNLPWAVAVLSVGGLFGYLAVDQVETRRVISTKDLEVVGLYATLAAHAIASESSARSK